MSSGETRVSQRESSSDQVLGVAEQHLFGGGATTDSKDGSGAKVKQFLRDYDSVAKKNSVNLVNGECPKSNDLSLRAWLHHFDLDGNGKISHHLSPADTDSIPSREIRTLIYYVCTSKCFG